MIKSMNKWNVLNKKIVESKEDLIEVLLTNRNINETERKAFFSDTPKFHDPFLFKDMKKAVDRIAQAIENNEKIMIYGDYDVDGVTGTSILYLTLKRLEANVSYYIPNRFREGYGPNRDAFQKFIDDEVSVVITVDNGISGIEEAELFKDTNTDLIITDHHTCRETIPYAYAIIHPKLKGETYPYKELSGCGVAFKFAHALLNEVPFEYLDLACLGTYADIVSLDGENRTIVKFGLKQTLQTENIGLMELLSISNVKSINEYTLGFMIGPRINAAGRLEEATLAVDLLTTNEQSVAMTLATKLDDLNNERRRIIDRILTEAKEMVEEAHEDKSGLVLYSDDWHEGVLGIVASRLVDLYSKPAIVLTKDQEERYKGSARTIAPFDMIEALNQSDEFLFKYGGHTAAAGLTIEEQHLESFCERFDQLACESEFCNELTIDCKMQAGIMNETTIKTIESFRPFGPSNKKPLYLIEHCEVIAIKTMGATNKHIRLMVKQGEHVLTTIGFNFGEYGKQLNIGDFIDIVGVFEINEYNNTKTIQFQIKDLSCDQIQVFDFRNKYFDKELLKKQDIIKVYFVDNYGIEDAVSYNDFDDPVNNLLLIDVPESETQLKMLLTKSDVSNLYLLFKDDALFSKSHLINRKKLGQVYGLLKKLKSFRLSDPKVQHAFKQIGFDKDLQKFAVQVFFELEFVIIEDITITVVENPEKRNLSDSKTYMDTTNRINFREHLLFSSTQDLNMYLRSLLTDSKHN
ncbi:single-stranded-DNA-specific exonuclease RecJ [Haloplasma contractile]|uniref:Single-stranded-DNA-specific exonuclease RecJ n=1 Tax=Haloplasma contractile SSD-17B TaxID=1033810 RepID=F7PVT2_9MOLU|nr:single-stranded-DNA-specific exonuclease RecJ [Haloplasma contractile]ERJ12746.1 Single-stranded-DNA-specific exonuclease RecJ protein [Haloplasma contractile SSD-17B]